MSMQKSFYLHPTHIPITHKNIFHFFHFLTSFGDDGRRKQTFVRFDIEIDLIFFKKRNFLDENFRDKNVECVGDDFGE